MPITPSSPDEDNSFEYAVITDGVVNSYSNNNNGRPDNEVYRPPVGGSRAFYRSFISGGTIISNHSNNNNGKDSITNPMIIEYPRNSEV